MKAYLFAEGATLDALRPVEVEKPLPGPGQLLVRMGAASLNFRDILVVTGRYPRAQQSSIVLLSDGAGEIVALGDGVSRFAIGDRVTPIFFQSWLKGGMGPDDSASALGGSIDGVLAEYCVFDEDGLVAIPRQFSLAEAATLPCAGLTAWNGLYGGKPVKSGDTVLTLGTGGVSMFALQFAHAAGARVIVTSSSDENLATASSLGADAVINYAKTPNWDQAVLALTGGHGADHVVETGGGGTLGKSIACTRRGGHIHLIGVIAPGQIDPIHILLAGVTVRGTEVGSREMHEAMVRAIDQSGIKPLIDRTFGFDAAGDALRYLETGQHSGKVVVNIADI